jgi:uncharacterized protein (DUF302 family)
VPTSPADLGPRRSSPYEDKCDMHGVVTKSSPWSVEETVSRFESEIACRGLRLFAVIDHSAAAAAHGLELRDTKLVVFGNPLTGTPAMQANPLVALDLPLKAHVWANADQTNVSYLSPSELAWRYELSAELARGLTGIETVTDAVLNRT